VTDPIDVVQQFCDGWTSFESISATLDHLSDDCVYHNIPMDPVVGIDAIRAFVDGFTAAFTGAAWEVRAIAATGSTVLTERVDTFFKEDGGRIDLPVMGTFEVGHDGKITAWRDYFDMNQFMSQMG
jgi:limonene-1,2-epoxide hydrolase